MTKLSSQRSPTFLIGAGGSGTAFAACAALRRYWNDRVRVIVIDTNPAYLVSSSILADKFFQVPPYAQESFPEKLCRIVESESISGYLPLFPLEIEIAASLKRSGSLPSRVELLAPSEQSSLITGDKYLTSEWLLENGLKGPRTCLGKPDFDAERYFIKPRMGAGSKNSRMFSRAELSKKTEREPLPSDRHSGYVIQECCEPPEVTIDVFNSVSGTSFRALCRERVEIKSGVSTKARVFEDSQLSAVARTLATKLGLHGAFCFQVMKFESDWYVMDINPRPGAGTAMCNPTGNDFFGAMFADRLLESTDRFFTPLIDPCFVTRQYSEFLMPL